MFYLQGWWEIGQEQRGRKIKKPRVRQIQPIYNPLVRKWNRTCLLTIDLVEKILGESDKKYW